MDLSALMASLGPMAGGAPDPDPLPSLPMGGAVPQVDAVGAQMAPMLPDPRPPRDLSKHHHAADFIRELAPMILSTLAAAKNPLYGAAMLQGSMRGAQLARQERMDAEAKAADTAKIKSAFVQKVMTDVHAIKDPVQQQKYLQLVAQVGKDNFGLPDGWTDAVPVEKTSATATLKSEVEKKLASFDKDPKWKAVAGTPQEAKISFQLSNGQSMSVASARRLLGQQFLDERGQTAYAPVVEKPEKGPPTDYSRGLERYARSIGKTLDTITTDDEMEFKKRYGQSDDRPLRGPDPILEQIRALTLANLQKNSGADVTPGQATAAGKLSDDFRMESKDFIQVSQAFNRIKASASNPSAAGDLALIFNYMKTLDPGSTVREGEFASAQNAGSIDDRIVATYNKILSGERLSPSQRADFVSRAKRLYERAASQHGRIVQQYRKRAKAIGVPEDLVITDYTIGDEPSAPAAGEPAKTAPPKKIGRFIVEVGGGG